MRILPLLSYIPTAKGLCYNFLSRQSVFPVYASFKITSRCHFGCPFCNVKKNPVRDLTTGEVKKILDNLSRSSVLMTSFEGGEPLLREDIGELLSYASRCKFYLLFTTSVKDLTEYPLAEYAKYIDFLHVSIDEGHSNLELFQLLPQLQHLPTQVSVQTVVTASTVDALAEKVRICYENKANIVIIPATHMDGTDDYFPDISAVEKKVNSLRRCYPDTIHTPRGYFNAYRKRRCSPASVVIAPDGYLYYPCHIQGTKGPSLVTEDLNRWLQSDEARVYRHNMKTCTRNCGWYQYYAVASYTDPVSSWETLKPMLFQGKK